MSGGRVDFVPHFGLPPRKGHLNVICMSLAYPSTHPPSAPELSCPGRGPSRFPSATAEPPPTAPRPISDRTGIPFPTWGRKGGAGGSQSAIGVAEE